MGGCDCCDVGAGDGEGSFVAVVESEWDTGGGGAVELEWKSD